MFARLRSLLRVTAVRLSIIYTVIFGILAVGIVAYMTGATVKVLREQYEESINEEIMGLARIYRDGGIGLMVRVLERRARAPGANLYIVTDPSGGIIAGNVPSLERGILRRTGWTGRPFRYERFGDREGETHRAIARVLELPNRMRILVGRDIGEHEGFRHVVGRAFNLAIGTMLALGVLTWFFVGRRALKRIDGVSQSSRRILAGDRTERLPVTGAGDEFDRLSENLNHMLDRIHRLDEGLKQMSDNIAHDLKTPVTRLRNKADEALSARSDPTARSEALEDIIGDCDQMIKTFDALLMISRVESGSTVASRQSLNAGDLIADVFELYEAVAEEQDFELRLEGPQETIAVYGNRELLSQALSNLIDNALKYGRALSGKSHITLSAEKRENGFAFIVADNGPGIAAEDRERVTERFVRIDESRNRTGNGLGLALVKAVAGMHDGDLVLEDNKPGLRVSLIVKDREDAS